MSLHEIFQHYIHAEWLADWEKAKAEHGDGTCEADLARTPPQRRADALAQIFRDAAANPDSAVPARFVHNIVWTAATFEATVCRLAETDGASETIVDPDEYRCSTIDGVPIDATEAIVNAVLNHVRRVIIDAPSTVIDLGRARRLEHLLRRERQAGDRARGALLPEPRQAEAAGLHAPSQQRVGFRPGARLGSHEEGARWRVDRSR